jgi:DOPA 4,5-dioxygenase
MTLPSLPATPSAPALPALPPITGFHAHVYFDADSLSRARQLCEAAAALFPLEMGRVHEKPVGPHPDWSCQLAFAPEVFGALVPWLAMHRQGLVVFIHPLTGNEVVDHRDRAIWLGAVRPLDLSALPGEPTAVHA